MPIPCDGSAAFLALVRVEYVEGEENAFVLPLAFAADPKGAQLQSDAPNVVICRLSVRGHEWDGGDVAGCLYDPHGDKGFGAALLDAVGRNRRFRAPTASCSPGRRRPSRSLRDQAEPAPEPAPIHGDQSNTLIAYGNRFILKLYRGIEEGAHPEVEIARALTEKASFAHSPPLAGTLTYRAGQGRSMTVGALFGFAPNEGDGWSYTMDALRHFFMNIQARPAPAQGPTLPERPFLDLVVEDLPPNVPELIGPYLESVRLMGQRTAEFHAALASITDDAEFAPEPFTVLYQRSLYQTVRTLVLRVTELLREQMLGLPEGARKDAQTLLARGGLGNACPLDHGTQNHGPADARPRRLPPRQPAFHRQGFRADRL